MRTRTWHCTGLAFIVVLVAMFARQGPSRRRVQSAHEPGWYHDDKCGENANNRTRLWDCQWAQTRRGRSFVFRIASKKRECQTRSRIQRLPESERANKRGKGHVCPRHSLHSGPYLPSLLLRGSVRVCSGQQENGQTFPSGRKHALQNRAIKGNPSCEIKSF